jgi:hypothetical protein
MRSSFVVLSAFFVIALSLPEGEVNSPVASITRYTPQDALLAKQSGGNFACRVNSVVIKTENPGDLDTVTVDSVRSAFINVATLEWTHISQTSFSSFDGRNEEKVLGTPGGDMGEFIQAIHAYAKVTGATLKEEEIDAMFNKYLKVMTRSKFFYQTDERAYMKLALATGCRNLHISEIGGMKRKKEEVLTQIAVPEHIGDPFIRYLATNATSLELNSDYIHAALAAYHRVLWTKPSPLSEKICYLEVKGPHQEAALINIKTPSYCVDQGLAPMVSSQFACPAPVFVNHVDAVKLLRREMAAIFTQGTTVSAQDVLTIHNTMAENNLEKFMFNFAPTVPTFTVLFQNSAPILTADPFELQAAEAVEAPVEV